MSNSKELQNQYNALTERLNSKKIDKAKLEARLEAIQKQQADILDKIKKLAKVETVPEAEAKLAELEKKSKKVLEEAVALLNDDQS